MEEIEKIIQAITEVTGLSRNEIISDKSKLCKSAREILCYIALKDRYGLTWMLMKTLKWRKSQVFFAMDSCKDRLQEELDYILLMNNVRSNLELYPIVTVILRDAKEKEKQIEKEMSIERASENARRIFGISYTEADNACIRNALDSALTFMQGYCRIGRQPRELLNRPY